MQRFGAYSIGLALACAGASVASAQVASVKPVSFGVLAGASVPVGDFSDAGETGYHIGALIDYKPSTNPLSLRAELVYNAFGAKSVSTIKYQAKITSVTANLVWNLPVAAASTVRPYLLGGAGLYHISSDVTGAVSASDSENKFGINAGGGIDLVLSGFTTFIEARYHNVFTDNTSTGYVPISVGIRF